MRVIDILIALSPAIALFAFAWLTFAVAEWRIRARAKHAASTSGVVAEGVDVQATPERVGSVPRGLDPQTELPAKSTEQKVSR